MSRKTKRCKLQPVSMASGNDVTTSDHQRAPSHLVYILQNDLLSWVGSLPEGDSFLDFEVVFALLKSLCDLLNHRWKTSMKQNILIEFFRCMAKHGIPFRYECSEASRFLSSEEYLEKYVPTMDLKLFFRDLSCLEYRLRSSIWGFHHIQMGTTLPGAPSLLASRHSSNISALRYQLCYACRKLNYRAVVANLANSEVLRMTSETIEKARDWQREICFNIQFLIYFDSPIVIWVALQATLAMRHDSSFDIGGRLVMLATMQSMIYTTTAARNTILMQLCEILITTILLGNKSHVSAIIELEGRVHSYNKNYENSSVWNAYKLIAEYDEWKKQYGFSGMILSTAQSLVEVAESMSYHGTLFLEVACQIWAKQGRCEDKISEAVSKILSKCPQLLGRVIRLLKAIKFDHEIEVITEEVCQERNTALLPGDSVWLDWCEPRIQHPKRYGKVTEVLSRCADILFRFLDYGSNRSSGRAWVLLHTVMNFVDPAQVITMWSERYDWWPHFHTVQLPPEAELRRAELLSALAEMPVE